MNIAIGVIAIIMRRVEREREIEGNFSIKCLINFQKSISFAILEAIQNAKEMKRGKLNYSRI
jgi:hypothetical protein